MTRYPACILATCCVPWTENFEFDQERFRKHVRQQIADGFRDLYVFGTAGEGHAVTEALFDAVTRALLDECAKADARAMIGVISLSLPTVIERIGRASEMGARSFQISLPSWGALNDFEVATFFAETCGRFPDCEFLHYNLPRANRILTGPEYGGLAAKHPNLVATKNSTTDEDPLRGLFEHAPQLRHFITEAGFAKAAFIGDCGFLVSIASLDPAQAKRYFEAGQARDETTLREMAGRFQAQIDLLMSSVTRGAHMDGAFDKMFCRIRDPEFPLRLLPPYMSVSNEEFEQFATGLSQL